MQRVNWNPWHGCHKCSEGCKNCFVFFLDKKRDRDTNIVTKSKTNFNLPIKKSRTGEYKIQKGSEVGVCFTSDFFIEEADAWREDAYKIIKERTDVTFLICTKRVDRYKQCLPSDWGDGYNNVQIAVSTENQNMADKRLPYLLEMPAKCKYIFAAPLLEDIDLSKYLASKKIDGVFVGGESYDNARECHFEWVQHIKNTCDKYGVYFDFHQTGSNFVKDGKKYKIRHKDEYLQARKGMKFL